MVDIALNLHVVEQLHGDNEVVYFVNRDSVG